VSELAPSSGLALRNPTAVVPFVVAAVALGLASSPFGGEALLAGFVAGVLVVIAAVDLERRVIPNQIVLPACAVALVGRIALTPGHALEYILAALVAAVFMLVPRLVSRNAVGMGDVKLAVLLGAALGWSVAGALAVAFVCVWPVAVAMVIRDGFGGAKRNTIPLGPFLALGALVVLVGPGLIG
jgi:leader peptidase (prepilin peptidase)/N-methyltransferase